MKELPQGIKDSLEAIRKSHRHYVDVKVIGGRCYVYESTSQWDRAHKRVKKITTYLGRITEHGEFIPSTPRRSDLVAAHVPSSDEGVAQRSSAYKARELVSKYDQRIIEELSSNGRMTIAELGKRIGLSAGGTEWHRKNVEHRYSIRYLAEIDLDKLGYLTYIIMIKFLDKIPAINEMRFDIDQEKSVQLALLVQGAYDLVIYAVFPKSGDAIADLYYFRSRIFPKYNFRMYVAPFYQSYSFVPLRDSFFDMLEDKVWTRSKEHPKPHGEYLMRREYALLKELNFDGAMDFTKIDSKYKLAKGSTRYTYHKLISTGMIKRITILMENMPLKYISVILLEKINHDKYMKHRESVLKAILDEGDGDLTNRYALVGDIKLPEGILFMLPVFKDEDVESAMRKLMQVGGMNMVNLIATNVIVGTLCYRKLDKKLTLQYNILKNEYGIEDNSQEQRVGPPQLEEGWDLEAPDFRNLTD